MREYLLAVAIVCTLLVPGTSIGDANTGPQLLRNEFAVNGTHPCLVRTPTGGLLAYNVGRNSTNSLYVVESTDFIHWAEPLKIGNVSTGIGNSSIGIFDMILARNGTYIILYYYQFMIWMVQSRDAIIWSSPINISEKRYIILDLTLIQRDDGGFMLGYTQYDGFLGGFYNVTVSTSPNCFNWSAPQAISSHFEDDVVMPGDTFLRELDMIQLKKGRLLTVFDRAIVGQDDDCRQSSSAEGCCWTAPASCVKGNVSQPALLAFDNSTVYMANENGLYTSPNGTAWALECERKYSDPSMARASTNELVVAYVSDYHGNGTIMVDRFLIPGTHTAEPPVLDPPEEQQLPPTNSTSPAILPNPQRPPYSVSVEENICDWMAAALVVSLAFIFLIWRITKGRT